MALSVGERLGHYEIAALIGKGGMGEVYRARDTKLDRDVAIKVLPAAVAREAHTCSGAYQNYPTLVIKAIKDRLKASARSTYGAKL